LIVVDASALTDILLGRPQALRAMRNELADQRHEPLHAPALIEPETLNALRAMARRGDVTERRAAEAVRDLGKVRMVSYPHGPFRDRVWELRHELTAYDATYLAIAEAIGESVLLTADRGLADRARRSIGAGRVRQIEGDA
jgi:predicted nucleic acid-binding protein